MTLSQLQQAVTYLFPTAVYPTTYTATVDSSGNATIALWNNTLGAQPTTDQLTTALAASQLAQAKTTQNALVTDSYNTARYGTPVSISVSGVTLTFPVDVVTQQNVMGYLCAYGLPNASAMPVGGVPLQDASNSVQMLTLPDLQNLAGVIANQSASAWTTMNSLLNQIAAATTVTAAQAIVWPA